MPSSKQHLVLQAADVLLWVVQREEDPAVQEAKARLGRRLDDFYISRGMSELIVRSWLYRIYSEDIRDEQLSRAREEVAAMERMRQERLKAFEERKALGASSM